MNAPDSIPHTPALVAKDSAAAPATDGATPMMAQFLDLKSKHPDALLFYRMGDFYELFFEDAVKAADALDIALTKRGKHAGEDVAMCGVPVERAEAYLERLIGKGFRVAVAEQTEDPAEAKKRKGAKALVRREIIRLVTPGTITEEALLDARAPARLAALGWAGKGVGLGLAWADVADGDLSVTPVDREGLARELSRVAPKELLIPEALLSDEAVRAALQEFGGEVALTPLPAARFDARAGERRLTEAYEVKSLDAFGDFGPAEISALGAVHDYVETTQAGEAPRLAPPSSASSAHVMGLDAAARANLEIVRTLSGHKRGSLIEAVDLCVSPAGSRLLLDRLTGPSAKRDVIVRRHEAVDFFLDRGPLRGKVRAALKGAPDVLRPWTRLVLNRGGPRDVGALGASLLAAEAIAEAFDDDALADPPKDVAGAVETLRDCAKGPAGAFARRVMRELVPEPPVRLSAGDFVAEGVLDALDEARALAADASGAMAVLARRYAERTGAKNLKIKRNAVIGWFIEVPASQEDLLLTDYGGERFIRRQSMANAVRFTTEEMTTLEAEIARAADTVQKLELGRFAAWRAEAEAAGHDIRRAADALSALDVASAAAELAEERGWVRPEMTDGADFTVMRGRHPVVERALKREGKPFTPNDAAFETKDGPALTLVTGPNMAGKSTFLRQNALILILAQAGLFTPAESARLGVADKLFSRVGAADDLARGRSTFTVEMLETAAILRQAGPKSFVILDEVGRGTATFDGLAIAWAVVEHLHDVNRCRTLFATHFHELTKLDGALTRLRNLSLRAREWKGDLVFLHEVADGPADKSYGVQAAKLAGLPAAAVKRAREVLDRLEKDQAGAGAALETLPLFAATAPAPDAGEAETEAETHAPHPAVERLKAINPDDLTPREALDALYALRGLVGDE